MLKTILTKMGIVLFALFLFTACDSTTIETIKVQGGDEVIYESAHHSSNYIWKQISGIPVSLINPNTHLLRFIAPIVTREEFLVFHLKNSVDNILNIVTVEIIPPNHDIDNTAPIFTSASTVSVPENQTVAMTLEASDTNEIVYSIYGGDSTSFTVNATTGVVTFNVAPDYESKSIYRFTAKATDSAGNETIQNITIMITDVDEVSPIITMLSPSNGAILSDTLTSLVFDIHDDQNGSGLDEKSIKITFTDSNTSYPLIIDNNTGYYKYTPSENDKLSYGNVTFSIFAEDKLNNEATRIFSIFIQEKDILSAVPVAIPGSAYAPATIRFSPKVTTDNAIQTYYWDFDGDGTYDRSDITANSYTWHYATPGDYNVTLKVVDANNEVMLGSTIVHILNTPPQVTVESSPSNGSVPLTVNFIVTAIDSDGIALYEWDFNGDGVYDYNSTSTGNVSFEYTEQGIFNAQLRVTDGKGAISLYDAPTTTVLVSEEGSPTINASGSPLSGNAPLDVNFSAIATDPQSKGFVLYEWDFDGDGVYDYNSTTSATTSFNYVAAGSFYPRIKATTADGRITYDSLEIIVNQTVGLSVSTDTIDISQSETVTIRTTTTAKTQMKIIIEDENYNTVKVIQDWILRDPGNYNDIWDGKRVNGTSVKEGKYYAVLLYKVGDEIKRLDLRNTTGGDRYNPSRSNAPRSFAPFDNRPLAINFSLPRSSEVVSFMGYSNSNTRIVTFRSRQPLGRGSYTDTWNAQNDEGVLITPPPGKWFMYGIWAFSLADNAIYVKSGAHVSAVTATPPIYTPDAHEADGKPATLKINFSLNKDANVELELFDAKTGITVATREYTGLSAGEQTIEFNGKNNHDIYLAPGIYTLGLRAVDENGYRSIMEYTVTRIYY